MLFNGEFSIILDVKQSQNNLILRLDMSDWFMLESYKNGILEIKAVNCRNSQNSFEEINKFVGELIWHYEFLSEKETLEILMDDGSNIEIMCDEISEEKRDLTIDELVAKFQLLEKHFQRISESNLKGWGKYQRLEKLLETEIRSEMNNLEKKKSFFEKQESLNAVKAESKIKFCERLLNYIEQVKKED